jgi:hypothetical protein
MVGESVGVWIVPDFVAAGNMAVEGESKTAQPFDCLPVFETG